MCVIDGDSMLPTLYNKQIVFIDKNPKYFYKNEIVVVNNNGMIIKRIKGVEGDAYYTTQDPTMYILDKVMIEFNGKEFKHFVKKKIPHDYYYILGDNQANSYDSKFFGLVSKKQIIGVVCEAPHPRGGGASD